MITIAVANQKGGVGKTTTAVNLSACLARMGRRVLLVDLDPQGNATDHLGQEPPDDVANSSFALIADKSPDFPSLLRAVSPNLQLAPAHIVLAEIDIKLFTAMNRETRLKRSLEQVAERFDYAIIDCAPSLGISTVNALCAATHTLITIQTNWFAYEALKRLMTIAADVMDEANPALVTYALATLHRANVNNNRAVLERVQEEFGHLCLKSTIRHTATLAEASVAKQPIIDYAHGSKAHQDYQSLAEEIIERVERQAGEEAQAS
jgi:chromosome partitioning protein